MPAEQKTTANPKSNASDTVMAGRQAIWEIEDCNREQQQARTDCANHKISAGERDRRIAVAHHKKQIAIHKAKPIMVKVKDDQAKGLEDGTLSPVVSMDMTSIYGRLMGLTK